MPVALRILPFEPAHLTRLVARPEQAGDAARLGGGAMDAAERGPAYTIVDGKEEDSPVLCCAGLVVNGPDHASAWALFADGMRPAQWAHVTRAIGGVLDAADYQRIDLGVRLDFPAAHRFARHLGFLPDLIVYARGAMFHEEQEREAA